MGSHDFVSCASTTVKCSCLAPYLYCYLASFHRVTKLNNHFATSKCCLCVGCFVGVCYIVFKILIAHPFYFYGIPSNIIADRWDLSAWDILSYRDQKVDIFIYNLLSRLDEYPLFKNGQYSELTADDFPRKDVYNFIVFQYGVQLHSFYERLNVVQWNMMIDLDEYVYIPTQNNTSHHINDYLIPYLERTENYVIEIMRYRIRDSVCVTDTNYFLNTVHVRGKRRDTFPKAFFRTDKVGFYAVHWAFYTNETYSDFSKTERRKKFVDDSIVHIFHFRDIMNRHRCRAQVDLDNIERICEYIDSSTQCFVNNANLFIHKRDVMDMDRNVSCVC
eukprot:787818_1